MECRNTLVGAVAVVVAGLTCLVARRRLLELAGLCAWFPSSGVVTHWCCDSLVS